MSHGSDRTSGCIEDESAATDQAGDDTFVLKFLECAVDCHLADLKSLRPLPFRRQRVAGLQPVLSDELAYDSLDLFKSRHMARPIDPHCFSPQCFGVI